MKTFFDSSVLVSLLCAHSKFKAAADAAPAEVSRQGLAGAIVYDAVHCFAARKEGAARIVTRNGPHFRLFSGTLEVVELAD